MTHRTTLIAVLCFTALAGRADNAYAQRLEQDLKAELLVKVCLYVTWPQGGRQVRISVLGQDPFEVGGFAWLNHHAQKEKRKNFTVKYVDSVKDYKECDVLFVSQFAAPGSEEKEFEDRFNQARKLVNSKPVILVTDSPGKAEDGAVFNFVKVQQSAEFFIRLEVNTDAITRTRLKIAAALLRIAKKVKNRQPNPNATP